MSVPEYIKLDTVKLQGHPTLSEKWVHDRIANDPAMLGLGDLILRDKERRQPGAGRLDLLLHDGEDQWYEVEIQLRRTDESHIMRTIEYWEQKSSPNVMRTADGVLQIIQAFSPSTSFNYKQDFIGLLEDGGVNNYPVFLPQKERLLLTIRLDQSPEISKALEDAGLDLLPYSVRDRRYRLRLALDDVERNRDLLSKILTAAHDQSLS